MKKTMANEAIRHIKKVIRQESMMAGIGYPAPFMVVGPTHLTADEEEDDPELPEEIAAHIKEVVLREKKGSRR